MDPASEELTSKGSSVKLVWCRARAQWTSDAMERLAMQSEMFGRSDRRSHGKKADGHSREFKGSFGGLPSLAGIIDKVEIHASREPTSGPR
jgi:hypothetical protein